MAFARRAFDGTRNIVLGRMDEGDELEIDSIFKDDQCILRKSICVATAWRYAGFSDSECTGRVDGVPYVDARRGGMKCASPSMSCRV